MPRHWSRRLLSRAITLPLSFLLSLPLGAPVLAEPGAHDLIRPVAAQMDGVGEAIQFEELRQDWLKGMPVRPERLDNADVVFIKRGWVDPESPEWDPSILFLLHGDYEAYQNTRDHRPRLRLALFDEEAKSPEEAKALFAAAEQRRREFAKSKRLPTRFFDLPDVDSFYLFGRRSQQSLDQAAARPKAETTAPAQPPGEPLDADQRARRVYPVHRGDDHAAGDGRAHTPRRTESPVDPLMGIRMGRRTAVALLATGVLWSALLGQPKPVPAQTAGTTFTVQPGERSGERIQAALNQAQPGDTVHLLSHEGRPTEFLLEPFEQLRVPPGVRLMGDGKDVTTIRREYTGGYPPAAVVVSSDVTIENLTIHDKWYALQADHVNRLTIRGCRLMGITLGSYLHHSVVEDSELVRPEVGDFSREGTTFAWQMWASTHNIIRRTRIVGNSIVHGPSNDNRWDHVIMWQYPQDMIHHGSLLLIDEGARNVFEHVTIYDSKTAFHNSGRDPEDVPPEGSEAIIAFFAVPEGGQNLFRNCIIAGADPDVIRVDNSWSRPQRFEHVLFDRLDRFAGTVDLGPGISEGDPLVENAAEGDLGLQPESPAIGKATDGGDLGAEPNEWLPLLLGRNVLLGGLLSVAATALLPGLGVTAVWSALTVLLPVALVHELGHTLAIGLTTGQWIAPRLQRDAHGWMLGVQAPRGPPTWRQAAAGPATALLALPLWFLAPLSVPVATGLVLSLVAINLTALFWGDAAWLWRPTGSSRPPSARVRRPSAASGMFAAAALLARVLSPAAPGGVASTAPAAIGAAAIGAIAASQRPAHGQTDVITVQPGQSVQAAIDRAQDGQTVFLAPGVHEVPIDATLRLKPGVHIVGTDRDGPGRTVYRVKTDGVFKKDRPPVIVGADRASLEHLAIEGHLGTTSVLLEGVSGMVIRGCALYEIYPSPAIDLRRASDNVIEDNWIMGGQGSLWIPGQANQGPALRLTESDRNTIRGNQIVGSLDAAVSLAASSDNVIANNTILGLFAADSSATLVRLEYHSNNNDLNFNTCWLVNFGRELNGPIIQAIDHSVGNVLRNSIVASDQDTATAVEASFSSTLVVSFTSMHQANVEAPDGVEFGEGNLIGSRVGLKNPPLSVGGRWRLYDLSLAPGAREIGAADPAEPRRDGRPGRDDMGAVPYTPDGHADASGLQRAPVPEGASVGRFSATDAVLFTRIFAGLAHHDKANTASNNRNDGVYRTPPQATHMPGATYSRDLTATARASAKGTRWEPHIEEAIQVLERQPAMGHLTERGLRLAMDTIEAYTTLLWVIWLAEQHHTGPPEAVHTAERAAIRQRLIRDTRLHEWIERALRAQPIDALTAVALRQAPTLSRDAALHRAYHLVAQLIDDEGRTGWHLDLDAAERADAEELVATLPATHPAAQAWARRRENVARHWTVSEWDDGFTKEQVEGVYSSPDTALRDLIEQGLPEGQTFPQAVRALGRAGRLVDERGRVLHAIERSVTLQFAAGAVQHFFDAVPTEPRTLETLQRHLPPAPADLSATSILLTLFRDARKPDSLSWEDLAKVVSVADPAYRPSQRELVYLAARALNRLFDALPGRPVTLETVEHALPRISSSAPEVLFGALLAHEDRPSISWMNLGYVACIANNLPINQEVGRVGHALDDLFQAAAGQPHTLSTLQRLVPPPPGRLTPASMLRALARRGRPAGITWNQFVALAPLAHPRYAEVSGETSGRMAGALDKAFASWDGEPQTLETLKRHVPELKGPRNRAALLRRVLGFGKPASMAWNDFCAIMGITSADYETVADRTLMMMGSALDHVFNASPDQPETLATLRAAIPPAPTPITEVTVFRTLLLHGKPDGVSWNDLAHLLGVARSGYAAAMNQLFNRTASALDHFFAAWPDEPQTLATLQRHLPDLPTDASEVEVIRRVLAHGKPDGLSWLDTVQVAGIVQGAQNQLFRQSWRRRAYDLDHLEKRPTASGQVIQLARSYLGRFGADLRGIAHAEYFSRLPLDRDASLEQLVAHFLLVVQQNHLPKSPGGPRTLQHAGLAPTTFFVYLPTLAAELFVPWIRDWNAARPVLAELAGATDPQRRRDLIAELGRHPEWSWFVVPILVERLRGETNESIQVAAVSALGQLGGDAAVAELRALAQPDSGATQPVREAAQAAIRQIIAAPHSEQNQPGDVAPISLPYAGPRWKVETYRNTRGIRSIRVNPDQQSVTLGISLRGSNHPRAGVHPRYSQGEFMLNVRGAKIPGLQKHRDRSVDLSQRRIAVKIRVPPELVRRPLNGAQVFVKSKNADGTDAAQYGKWVNFPLAGEWLTFFLEPTRGEVDPQGYTAPGFDPTRIVVVGLKIGASGASKPSWSFDGEVEVGQFEFLPAQQSKEPAQFTPYLLDAPAGPVAPSRERFQVGWGGYLLHGPARETGQDLGRIPGQPHIGFSNPETRQLLDAHFAALKQAGITVVHYMSLFADFRGGMRFAPDGTPLGFDEYVDADMEALLETAQRHGLKLIPVLLDFSIADTIAEEFDTPAGEHPDLITDPVKRAKLLEILGGFLRKHGNHESILSWGGVNEPIGMAGLSMSEIQGFLADLAGLIRETPHKPVTFSARYPHMASYYIHLAQPGDSINIHHYIKDDPEDAPYAGIDVPVTQFNVPKGVDVWVGEADPADPRRALDVAFTNGYPLAVFWADKEYQLDLHAVREWMEQLKEKGHAAPSAVPPAQLDAWLRDFRQGHNIGVPRPERLARLLVDPQMTPALRQALEEFETVKNSAELDLNAWFAGRGLSEEEEKFVAAIGHAQGAGEQPEESRRGELPERAGALVPASSASPRPVDPALQKQVHDELVDYVFGSSLYVQPALFGRWAKDPEGLTRIAESFVETKISQENIAYAVKEAQQRLHSDQPPTESRAAADAAEERLRETLQTIRWLARDDNELEKVFDTQSELQAAIAGDNHSPTLSAKSQLERSVSWNNPQNVEPAIRQMVAIMALYCHPPAPWAMKSLSDLVYHYGSAQATWQREQVPQPVQQLRARIMPQLFEAWMKWNEIYRDSHGQKTHQPFLELLSEARVYVQEMREYLEDRALLRLRLRGSNGTVNVPESDQPSHDAEALLAAFGWSEMGWRDPANGGHLLPEDQIPPLVRRVRDQVREHTTAADEAAHAEAEYQQQQQFHTMLYNLVERRREELAKPGEIQALPDPVADKDRKLVRQLLRRLHEAVGVSEDQLVSIEDLERFPQMDLAQQREIVLDLQALRDRLGELVRAAGYRRWLSFSAYRNYLAWRCVAEILVLMGVATLTNKQEASDEEQTLWLSVIEYIGDDEETATLQQRLESLLPERRRILLKKNEAQRRLGELRKRREESLEEMRARVQATDEDDQGLTGFSASGQVNDPQGLRDAVEERIGALLDAGIRPTILAWVMEDGVRTPKMILPGDANYGDEADRLHRALDAPSDALRVMDVNYAYADDQAAAHFPQGGAGYRLRTPDGAQATYLVATEAAIRHEIAERLRFHALLNNFLHRYGLADETQIDPAVHRLEDFDEYTLPRSLPTEAVPPAPTTRRELLARLARQAHEDIHDLPGAKIERHVPVAELPEASLGEQTQQQDDEEREFGQGVFLPVVMRGQIELWLLRAFYHGSGKQRTELPWYIYNLADADRLAEEAERLLAASQSDPNALAEARVSLARARRLIAALKPPQTAADRLLRDITVIVSLSLATEQARQDAWRDIERLSADGLLPEPLPELIREELESLLNGRRITSPSRPQTASDTFGLAVETSGKDLGQLRGQLSDIIDQTWRAQEGEASLKRWRSGWIELPSNSGAIAALLLVRHEDLVQEVLWQTTTSLQIELENLHRAQNRIRSLAVHDVASTSAGDLTETTLRRLVARLQGPMKITVAGEEGSVMLTLDELRQRLAATPSAVAEARVRVSFSADATTGVASITSENAEGTNLLTAVLASQPVPSAEPLLQQVFRQWHSQFRRHLEAWMARQALRGRSVDFGSPVSVALGEQPTLEDILRTLVGRLETHVGEHSEVRVVVSVPEDGRVRIVVENGTADIAPEVLEGIVAGTRLRWPRLRPLFDDLERRQRVLTNLTQRTFSEPLPSQGIAAGMSVLIDVADQQGRSERRILASTEVARASAERVPPRTDRGVTIQVDLSMPGLQATRDSERLELVWNAQRALEYVRPRRPETRTESAVPQSDQTLPEAGTQRPTAPSTEPPQPTVSAQVVPKRDEPAQTMPEPFAILDELAAIRAQLEADLRNPDRRQQTVETLQRLRDALAEGIERLASAHTPDERSDANEALRHVMEAFEAVVGRQLPGGTFNREDLSTAHAEVERLLAATPPNDGETPNDDTDGGSPAIPPTTPPSAPTGGAPVAPQAPVNDQPGELGPMTNPSGEPPAIRVETPQKQVGGEDAATSAAAAKAVGLANGVVAEAKPLALAMAETPGVAPERGQAQPSLPASIDAAGPSSVSVTGDDVSASVPQAEPVTLKLITPAAVAEPTNKAELVAPTTASTSVPTTAAVVPPAARQEAPAPETDTSAPPSPSGQPATTERITMVLLDGTDLLIGKAKVPEGTEVYMPTHGPGRAGNGKYRPGGILLGKILDRLPAADDKQPPTHENGKPTVFDFPEEAVTIFMEEERIKRLLPAIKAADEKL